MTIVTINGEAWVVGVTWRKPPAWRALRFAFPPPDTQAFVEAAGQPGFVTDRNDAAFAGAVSLGAALRARRHALREPWIAAAECDDGRVALVGHHPDMPHLAPEMVLDTPRDLPALARLLDQGAVTLNVYATPALAVEGALPLDLSAVRITDGMRLRQRAPPSIAWPAVSFFAAGALFTVGLLAIAAALFATPADAQDGTTQLPLPPAATVDVIQPDPPPPEEAAPPPPPEPPPSPEESIDEAAEALIKMLATDDPAQAPPMAECAIDLLRSRLATAVDGDDVLVAIAIENELLALCSQRQKLVLEVLATELVLASMVAGEPLEEAVPEAAAILPAAQPDPPAAATLDQLEAETAPAVVEEQPVQEPEPPASPGFSWVTVLGSAGNLRAALTDGTAVWWVREGDELSGGWQVTRVSAQPPGVTLSHRESGHHALPFHSGPAAGTDAP